MTKHDVSSAVDDLITSVSGYTGGDKSLPVSTKMRKRNARLLKDARPGDLLEELGGIYAGTYKPCDTGGASLGLTFNVIAAPRDLGQVRSFAHTVRDVAALSNWHGYNGENYGCAREIYQALKDGSYEGGWIIPPAELLGGRNPNNHLPQYDNLYVYKNEGAFAGTFKTEAAVGPGMPHVYWSSTEPFGDPDKIVSCGFATSFLEASVNSDYKNAGFMSCRPVRLMLARQGGAP